MVKIVEGNLLDAAEKILAHQVNCKGIMGGGVAFQLKKRFPGLSYSYNTFCFSNNYNPEFLLGECQLVHHGDKIIANLFGQDGTSRAKCMTQYDKLRKCLENLNRYCMTTGFSVAMPYGIGCGLAGGDWNIVYPMICEVFKEVDVTLYRYNK